MGYEDQALVATAIANGLNISKMSEIIVVKALFLMKLGNSSVESVLHAGRTLLTTL